MNRSGIIALGPGVDRWHKERRRFVAHAEVMVGSQLGLKILYVEDNEEIREALVSLLEEEGYEVTSCLSAEDGLALLKADRYDLIITDYSLLDHHGTWMVREARRAAVLGDTPVLMVTAHPSPDTDDFKVMRKPLDLDDFLREVYDMVAPARARELEKARAELARTGGTPPAAESRRAELTLYISSASPSSLKALRNLRRLLEAYRPTQVQLEVCDLLQDPSRVRDDDRIAFTPTLVKRAPGAKTWILGDLEDASTVTDMLDYAGVEKAR